MKTFGLIMTCLLVIAITTTSGVVGEGNDTVYDSTGEALKPNVPYYISFMTSEYKMWICRLNWGTLDNKTCPQQPVMYTNPSITMPTQVMFILSKPDSVVRESAPLKIKFVNPQPCKKESGFWRVVPFNSTTTDGEVLLKGSKFCNASTFTIHKNNEYFELDYHYNGVDITRISLSLDRGGKYRLLSMKMSGIMEIYFYRNLEYLE